MTFLTDAYRKAAGIARRTGITRNKGVRRAADAVKSFAGDTVIPFAVPIQGFKFKGMTITDRLKGSYEPETTALFKRAIKPGMTAVDIGAQRGYFALLMSKLAGPTGKVYAFEPFADSYGMLADNIRRNAFAANIEPVMKGASDAIRTDTYYIPSASIFPVKGEEAMGKGLSKDRSGAMPGPGLTANIECLPLDSYFQGKLSPVDFVKMDIEGSEELALQGMKGIFAANPQLIMVIEIAPKVLDKIGRKPEAVLALLRGYGFKLEVIQGDGSTRPAGEAEIVAKARAERYINIFCAR